MNTPAILPNAPRRPTRRRGQATVEFALIAWPFFMFLLALTDFAQFYFYEESLRYALNEAGRFATPGSVFTTQSQVAYGLTNCAISSSTHAGQPMSRYEGIWRTFSNNLAVNLGNRTNHFKIMSGATAQNINNPGPGQAGEYVRITVTYDIRFITPIATLLATNRSFNGTTYTVRAQSTFLNEPSANFVYYPAYYSDEIPP